MKALPEILHDVRILLSDPRVLWVEIERGDHEPLDARSSAFQFRLYLDANMKVLCRARSWLGGQWGIWREHRGWLGGGSFDVRDVLATDWRIIS